MNQRYREEVTYEILLLTAVFLVFVVAAVTTYWQV